MKKKKKKERKTKELYMEEIRIRPTRETSDR